MDCSSNYSPGNQSDRSEYARRLGARVGVNFGPVFESVSYLMGRYCKSSYSLKRCLEALNSDEKMRKKIAREIWYHYTHGVLVYEDKLGVDLDEYNEYCNAYTLPDEDCNKVATGDKSAFAGIESDTVSNDDDDVEIATIKTDIEAAVGLTDDERLMAATAASFGYAGGDGDGVSNDEDDIDAESDHYVDDVDIDGNDVIDDDDDNTDEDATVQSDDIADDDVDDDNVDNADDDATVQSDDTAGDDVDDDNVDNADDDAIVQSVDTDGDYVNEDDVDNTDDDANIQSADSDGDDNNNNNDEDDGDATVQSDDDSTVPSDYDDVVVGFSNGGVNSNRCDSTGSSSPSDENVYTADSDELRANTSDDSGNVPPEDNDSVSSGNYEELVSSNSYEENGDVNDVDDAFIPSDEVVTPSSCGDNGSDDPPFNNGEASNSDSDEFVTTSDEDDDEDSYIIGDPVDNFLGTLQEQCMWLYKSGLGEGDGKFKPDPIRRRARMKKIADFYFAEKMDGYYPRIKYQKPTYQNGYEFGLTDYLRRLGKRLGVEFGPVFEGCAIKMGRYLRSTRTLQRCVDIINNDEEMRRGLARSVWHHFIEGIMQKIT